MTRRYVGEATKGALARIREASEAASKRLIEAKASGRSDAVEAEQASLREFAVAERNVGQRRKDFEGGRLEAEFARMWAVASGRETMGGYRGEDLKRELETLVAEAKRRTELAPQGMTDEAGVFSGLLSDFVATRWFEPHPQGHSYCGCGRTDADLATAGCLKRKTESTGVEWHHSTKPDLAYADPFTCSGCPHNVQMVENRSWWETRLRSYFGQSQTAVSEHMGAACRKMGEVCADHIVRCYEEGSPMTVQLNDGRRT